MKAELAALYEAFAARELSDGGPAACIFCCASPEAMARLVAAPRDAITFEDLLAYHDAAKGPDEATVRDLLYVLPRTMEFLAQWKEPKTAGAETLFSHYMPEDGSALTATETAALEQFLEALGRAHLTELPERKWPHLIMVYRMAVSGGLPYAAVARAIADPPQTAVAVQNLTEVILRDTNRWQQATGYYEVSDARAEAAMLCLRDALSSDAVLLVLEWGALGGVPEDEAARASVAHQVMEQVRRDRP